MEIPKRRFCFALTIVLLAALVRAEPAAERAAKAGELIELKGLRVLRLFGADLKERGFAHGYLLADNIRDDTDAALQSLPMFNAEKFERRLLPWAIRKFDWDDAAEAELSGIYDGMQARIGNGGLQSKTLGRPLKLDDLRAINVIADYFGPACSAFAAAGKRTAELGVLHARTLDFPIGPKAIKDQVLIVSEPHGTCRGWVAIGWPGLIVQFSGMNADGLVVCLHDGYNVVKEDAATERYLPRGLLLRRILEQVDASSGDPTKRAAEMVAAKPTACGNLFHLSWPSAAAAKAGVSPSAAIEFDSSPKKPDIRRMQDDGTMVVTNHFLLHNAPTKCDRFGRMTKGLELLENAKTQIGLIEARKVLMAAEQAVAAHSIYFLPDKLELHIALTKDNVVSPRVPPVAFALKDLLRGKQ